MRVPSSSSRACADCQVSAGARISIRRSLRSISAGEEHQSALDHAFEFEFGLERVLDGIDALVRSR